MMALKCTTSYHYRVRPELCILTFNAVIIALDEKNDKLKIIIRNKIDEYLGRAEKLKEYLAKAEESKSRSAMGANGASTSGVGGKTKGTETDGDDAEIKKLRAGLTSQSLLL